MGNSNMQRLEKKRGFVKECRGIKPERREDQECDVPEAKEERVSGRREWSAGPDAVRWASKTGLRFDHWI